MDRSKEWLAPLTGVAFVIIGIVSFAIGGEPVEADEGAAKVVEHYVDNKDAIQISAFLGVAAGALLIFFGAYLRKLLHAAGGEGEFLSLVAFVGLVTVAIGFAIDGTIMFAAAEAAEDVDPVAVQALQALWDNDFLPIMLGVLCFLWATGISIIRTGILPKWLGGLMIFFGVVGVTPVGFASAIFSALLVLALGIVLSLRARSATPPATPPAQPPAV